MTPKISREDKPSGRFISLEEKLEILDRLKSGDKLTSVCEKFNRNESTIRTVGKNESKMRARASAGASSGLKKSSRTKDLLLTKTENRLITWTEDCNRKNIPLNTY